MDVHIGSNCSAGSMLPTDAFTSQTSCIGNPGWFSVSSGVKLCYPVDDCPLGASLRMSFVFLSICCSLGSHSQCVWPLENSVDIVCRFCILSGTSCLAEPSRECSSWPGADPLVLHIKRFSVLCSQSLSQCQG